MKDIYRDIINGGFGVLLFGVVYFTFNNARDERSFEVFEKLDSDTVFEKLPKPKPIFYSDNELPRINLDMRGYEKNILEERLNRIGKELVDDGR